MQSGSLRINFVHGDSHMARPAVCALQHEAVVVVHDVGAGDVLIAAAALRVVQVVHDGRRWWELAEQAALAGIAHRSLASLYPSTGKQAMHCHLRWVAVSRRKSERLRVSTDPECWTTDAKAW